MSDEKLVIVFALFPGVTQLDFTGPHQVFSRLPGATVILASRAGGTVEADGITFAGLRRLADISTCDVVCVPGGGGVTDNAIHDEAFLGELRRLAATARFVTSVCTGSQALQLQMEYAPAPPFDAGLPETAPPAVLARVRERNAPLAAHRREAVEAA